jgi:formate dehydrogenase accessory protein FdhD
MNKMSESSEENNNDLEAIDREAITETSVSLWQQQHAINKADYVATETAVALVYNGVSHVVMMASPVDLEAFALGFSLTEAIVASAEDVYDICTRELEEGIEVAITISNQCMEQLKGKRRNLSGRTGCGLCGAESLKQVRLPVNKVIADFSVNHKAINKAVTELPEYQPMQGKTGALHGAAWCDTSGSILQLVEDVGRHNALDKLIGKCIKNNKLEFNQPGFVLISSRASYEILQKSAMVNIGMVVAASAPTSLAISIANEANITLVGFARQNRHVVYTNTHRLIE